MGQYIFFKILSIVLYSLFRLDLRVDLEPTVKACVAKIACKKKKAIYKFSDFFQMFQLFNKM